MNAIRTTQHVTGPTLTIAVPPEFAGRQVEVEVRVVPTLAPRQPGEGFLRTEGALKDDPHWDAIMEEIYRERKTDTRREILE